MWNGKNDYEANALSNGSGKSSIFESIFFALFGKTSQGISYPQNRYLSGECLVKLDFMIDEVNYTIIRTQKGKSSSVKLLRNNEDISGRNKSDTENIIQRDIIKLSKDLFLSIIFLSQGFSGKLSSLTPGGRKERIETLIDTNIIIDKFRDEIQALKSQYESEKSDTSSAMSYETGIYHNTVEENKRILQQIEQLKLLAKEDNLEEVDNKIKEIKDENNSLSAKRDLLLEEWKTENDKIRQLESEFHEEENKVKDLIRDYESKIREKESEIVNLDLTNKNIQEEIDYLRNSDKCPTCGKRLDNADDEHIKKSIAENEEKIELNNKSIDKLESETKLLKEEKSKLKLPEKPTQDTTVLDTLVEKGKKVKDLISQNEEILNELNLRRDKCLQNKDTSELEKKLKENKLKLIDISEKMEKYEKDLLTYEEYANVANHCSSLISKQFRNYLLKSVVDFMNNKLKYYSSLVFSNTSDVVMFVQEGNNLDIFLGEASYESLSAGEKRKCDLLIVLVQRDLALNISGLNCNVLILDEILEGLDEIAINTVMELLMNVSSDIESLFLISHKDVNIGFDSIIEVVKGKDRISHVNEV